MRWVRVEGGMKKCKNCREPFTPRLPMQVACSPACALAMAVSKRGKEEKRALVLERKADKEKREKLKSKAQWAREAQTAFNAYIRLRDDADPCISCGRYHAGQYHAGHYLSVGARPELRFEPLNVHKQCAPCNSHLSGNIVLYRVALRKRIGEALVDWLEGPHPAKHYDIDALKAIKAEYTAKARELKKAIHD